MKAILVAAVAVSTLLSSALQAEETKPAESTQTIGLFRNDPGAFEGFTLFSPSHSFSTYLVNMKGEMVNAWHSKASVAYAVLLDDGLLLRAVKIRNAAFMGLPMVHGRLEMVDWEGKVVWSFNYSSPKKSLHHGFTVMPNGHILACSYDLISRDEALAAGRDPELVGAEGVAVERIVEIKPNLKEGGGEIVWSWSTFDHLVQDFDKSKSNFGDPAKELGRFDFNYLRMRSQTKDWNHVNGVGYHPELDLIVVNVHVNDEFVVIDHSTTPEESKSSSGGKYGKGGEILFRYGNPKVYRGQGERHYYALHNAHWIPKGLPGSGQLMVLNNRPRAKSSVVEVIDLPFGKSGTAPDVTAAVKPTTVYDQFHTRNMGGAQRLPNGNTLVFESVEGRIIEITPDGKRVWEYVVPVANNAVLAQGAEIPANPRSGDLLNEYYLAHRYAPDHPAFAGKELVSQGPIEAKPSESEDGGFFYPTGLSEAKKAEYKTAIEAFETKRRATIQSLMRAGDRQGMISTMTRLAEEQRSQMAKILNEEQLAEFDEWSRTQRQQRRGGR